MIEKKEYESPKAEKLVFNFNSVLTASPDHQLKINQEEGDCGQSEDTIVQHEIYGCNTWVECY